MIPPVDVPLEPPYRTTLARAHYLLLEQRLGAPPSGRIHATASIHPARVRFAERVLGKVPAELVAAWAAVGSPGGGSLEGFSPETACTATRDPHLRYDNVPERFVALRGTDVRYTYDALLNEALVPPESLPPEPRIVTVRFESGGFELQDEPCDFDTWVRRNYLGEGAQEPPAWFMDAFRVRLSTV